MALASIHKRGRSTFKGSVASSREAYRNEDRFRELFTRRDCPGCWGATGPVDNCILLLLSSGLKRILEDESCLLTEAGAG